MEDFLSVDSVSSSVSFNPSRKVMRLSDGNNSLSDNMASLVGSESGNPVGISENKNPFSSLFNLNSQERGVNVREPLKTSHSKEKLNFYNNMSHTQFEICKALASITNSLERSNISKREPLRVIFHGLEHEDPVLFLHELQAYFSKENIDSSNEKLYIASQHLRGQADKWFEPLRVYNLTYPEFCTTFLNKYNHPDLRSELTAKLYGKRQEIGEGAEMFILQKKALFSRLSPLSTETEIISVLMSQLLPHLRSRIRLAFIDNLDDFSRICTQIEKDTAEEHRMFNNFRANNCPVEPFQKENSHQFVRGPPYPCRNCGGDHYRNKCPRRRESPPQNVANNNQMGFSRIQSHSSQPLRRSQINSVEENSFRDGDSNDVCSKN